MENASKALIIAGAILLAILLIGLGIFIFGQVSNTIDNTGLDQLAVQQFNSQFEPYEGTKSGSQVKQLLRVVISNNLTHTDDPSMKVKVNGVEPVDSTTLPGNRGKNAQIGSGKMYNVNFIRGSSGLINNINIAEK